MRPNSESGSTSWFAIRTGSFTASDADPVANSPFGAALHCTALIKTIRLSGKEKRKEKSYM